MAGIDLTDLLNRTSQADQGVTAAAAAGLVNVQASQAAAQKADQDFVQQKKDSAVIIHDTAEAMRQSLGALQTRLRSTDVLNQAIDDFHGANEQEHQAQNVLDHPMASVPNVLQYVFGIADSNIAEAQTKKLHIRDTMTTFDALAQESVVATKLNPAVSPEELAAQDSVAQTNAEIANRQLIVQQQVEQGRLSVAESAARGAERQLTAGLQITQEQRLGREEARQIAAATRETGLRKTQKVIADLAAKDAITRDETRTALVSKLTDVYHMSIADANLAVSNEPAMTELLNIENGANDFSYYATNKDNPAVRAAQGIYARRDSFIGDGPVRVVAEALQNAALIPDPSGMPGKFVKNPKFDQQRALEDPNYGRTARTGSKKDVDANWRTMSNDDYDPNSKPIARVYNPYTGKEQTPPEILSWMTGDIALGMQNQSNRNWATTSKATESLRATPAWEKVFVPLMTLSQELKRPLTTQDFISRIDPANGMDGKTVFALMTGLAHAANSLFPFPRLGLIPTNATAQLPMEMHSVVRSPWDGTHTVATQLTTLTDITQLEQEQQAQQLLLQQSLRKQSFLPPGLHR